MPTPSTAPHGRERHSFAPQDLLRILAERGDVIAQRAGRVFLLIDLEEEDFERLAMYGADTEDLEDEPDDDDQGEPSLMPLHLIDRAAPAQRRKRA